MDELMKREAALHVPQSEDTYRSIRGYVIEAQRQVYAAVNTAMVTAKSASRFMKPAGKMTGPLTASRCCNIFPNG